MRKNQQQKWKKQLSKLMIKYDMDGFFDLKEGYIELEQFISKLLKEKEILKKYIEKHWGERCETTDFEDFPELKENINLGKEGVCACCEAWRCFDYLFDD